MASYMLLVLVPPSEQDIEEAVGELIEPYSKWIELPPYKEYLKQWEINQEVWHYGIPKESLEQIARKMKERGGEVGVDEKGLYRLTTRNPQGRWDSWRVGGSWDGVIQGKRHSDGRVGHNLGQEHEQLQYNTCVVSQLPKFLSIYELVTPDGVWHSWGEWSKPSTLLFDHMVELTEITEQYVDHIAVCIECHF
jgi:hypothetical protein